MIGLREMLMMDKGVNKDKELVTHVRITRGIFGAQRIRVVNYKEIHRNAQNQIKRHNMQNVNVGSFVLDGAKEEADDKLSTNSADEADKGMGLENERLRGAG